MKQLQITARAKIHEGKLEEFKEAAAACLQSVLDRDEGTRQYDWFLSEDQTEYVIREIYDDSDAMLQHLANMGDALGNLMNLCDLTIEVFGDPSPELAEAAGELVTGVYSYLQGMDAREASAGG